MTTSPTSATVPTSSNGHHALAFPVDSINLFEALAKEMNDHPEVYNDLGWCDMDLGVVMQRDGAPFSVAIRLREHGCEQVVLFEPGDGRHLDCWVEGDLGDWEAMFEDIVTNGMATGKHTLSSLVLLGDRIAVKGHDSMGVDLFFRYNQTLQSFFDGAAALVPARLGEGQGEGS